MLQTLPTTKKRGRPSLSGDKPKVKPAVLKKSLEANSLGSRIKFCRKELGMSQDQLAQPEYVASYISAIERDKIRPSLKALQLLASRLAKPVEYLLYGGDSVDPGTGPGRALSASLTRVRLLLELAELEGANTERWQEIAKNIAQIPAFELTEYDRVTLMMIQGRLLQHQGDYDPAENAYLTGLDLAGKTGQFEAQIELKSRLGNLALAQNHVEQALDLYREVLAICEENRELVPAILWVEVLSRLAGGLLAHGQKDEALELYAKIRSWQEKAGNLFTTAHEYRQIATTYRTRQDLRAAERYEGAALNNLLDLQRRQVETECQAGIGEWLVQNDRIDEGERLLEEALKTVEAGLTPSSDYIAQIFENLARIRLKQGQLEEAYRLSGQALSVAQCQQAQGKARLVVAEIEEELGQVEKAEVNFKLALECLEANGNPELLAGAYKAYSKMLERRGELGQALQYIKKALLLKT